MQHLEREPGPSSDRPFIDNRMPTQATSGEPTWSAAPTHTMTGQTSATSPKSAPAKTIRLELADEAATAALGGLLARAISPGFVMHLSGDLGAGKTTLARHLIRALGYTGRVKSPTFALVELYNFPKFDLYHFDFYRLTAQEAWREAGFEEQLDGAAAALVEWPEMAGDTLPAPDVRVRLEQADDDSARLVILEAYSDAGVACLNTIADARSCEPD
ncbi:MAG: tRNA (adenosine(37)-N6)-threonylcarbamoyltransferase complex ATPase subunit type 1 TsaE [Burkholderiaceae bacterium]